MRCKSNFRNEPINSFSEIPAFRPGWKPHKGHASLEVFLSCVEKELFSNEMNDSTQSNLSGEEWKALRHLVDDMSILIKGADKSSSMVVWIELTTARKLLDDYEIPIYTRMLNLAKILLLV